MENFILIFPISKDKTKMMEKRAVMHFLFLKGFNNKLIQTEINSVYDDDPISLRTIQKWTHRFKNGNHDLNDGSRIGRPKKSNLIPKIEEILIEDEGASCKKISELLSISDKTIKRILIEEMQMMKIHSHWIPHQLTMKNREKRVECPKEILKIIENASLKKRANILTQDESWFFFENPRDWIWQKSTDPRQKKIRRNISSKKIMISVVWSSNGIHSITKLNQGEKFNRDFFINTVLKDLEENMKIKRPKKILKGLYLHMDNARPHCVGNELQKKDIKRIPHPPYSPDLAPSDFYLFGYLKNQISGNDFDSSKELFGKIKEILLSIPLTVLRSVYEEWVSRLKKCIEEEGEYI